MQRGPVSGERSLVERFRSAFRGMRRAVASEKNFRIHFLVAGAVLVAAAVLGAEPWQWAVLSLSIATVLVAEIFNTAIERLAKAVTDQHNEHVRDALDIASAAVLAAALMSSVVGALILGWRLGIFLGLWPN